MHPILKTHFSSSSNSIDPTHFKTMLRSGSHGTPPIPSPSPARLGFSTPSPSLSNPNPNPTPLPTTASTKPSNLAPALTPPPVTSASLLSLLPPLPRAQSLLLQLSSLSSLLFSLSPNRALWSSSYRGNPPSFLPSPSPIPIAPPPSSAKDLLSLFASLQAQLCESVSDLQEILDLQNSTSAVAREIRSADSCLLAFSSKIKDAELLLDRLVDDYTDYHHCSTSTGGINCNLDLNEVLAYAHKISYTTFAPPEHGAGLAPLRGALPPAPQDNEMRASQLYQFADLDVGVPKKGTEGKERGGAEASNDVLMEPTPPREEMQMPAVPMLPISVPPGWKKGMPVELPMELPPVPPGWKPGDPVPLPPLDGVLIGNREEVGRMPVPASAPALPVLQKGPEAIQVQYVELDINPDQDDYSSEYSSDAGSSDEDDDD